MYLLVSSCTMSVDFTLEVGLVLCQQLTMVLLALLTLLLIEEVAVEKVNFCLITHVQEMPYWAVLLVLGFSFNSIFVLILYC